jgi:O-acetylhomoserine/O-acetylserine sulfhydrylase-like pyridoxal-dependent enzyme
VNIEDRPPSATSCVHAGDPPDASTGAVEPPLHLASAFAFDSAEQAAGAFLRENDHLIYGRWGNPTVRALELKVASLEAPSRDPKGHAAGYDACATASGMAAMRSEGPTTMPPIASP